MCSLSTAASTCLRPDSRACSLTPSAPWHPAAPPTEHVLLLPAGIVYNITGGRDLTLMEVNRVSEVVTSLADPACNIIFGAVVDDMYEGEIHVTIIATGGQPWLCCSAWCSAVQHGAVQYSMRIA